MHCLTSSDNKNVTNIRSANAAGANERERLRIVDTAIDELAFSGPELFSMESVARRCDLSQDKIATHFRERASLLREVVNQVTSRLVDACEGEMRKHDNYADRLLGICQVHFDEQVSPTRLVAVWTQYSGTMMHSTEYRAIFAKADERIFAMVRECVASLSGPFSNDRDATSIAHGIFGTIDRHWIEEPILRGKESLSNYYENSFQAVKTVLSTLFPKAYKHPTELTHEFAYTPNPAKFDAVVRSLVSYVDEVRPEDITQSGFERKFGFTREDIEANGRSWDDVLVSSVQLIAESIDHQDLLSKVNAGDDPKAQIEALIGYENKTAFTINRALWWYRIANSSSLATNIYEIDDTNDRYFLSLLMGPLEELNKGLDSPVDSRAIARSILAIKNESWLSTDSEMTAAEFERLKKRDVDNCIALLSSTMRHSFGALPPDGKNFGLPASHRERIYNATALAVLEHGMWGFTYADLTRHCGLDAYRIRRLFESKRQIVLEAIDWYLDKHDEICRQILDDTSLSAAQTMAQVSSSFFRDEVYQSHIVSLWNWTWVEAQNDHELKAICESADDAIISYFQQAIQRIDDSLDDITTRAMSNALYALSERFMSTAHTADSKLQARDDALKELLALLQLFFPGVYSEWSAQMLLSESDAADAAHADPNVLYLDLSVEHSATRRAAIVESAIQLISFGGVSALSFPRLAEESGISLTTIQFHFPSTRGLLMSVLQHVLNEMTERREHALAQVDDHPETRIATIINNEIDSCLESPVRARANAALYSEAITDPMLAPAYRAWDRRVADTISVEMDRLANMESTQFEPDFAAMGLQLGMEKVFDQAGAMENQVDFEIHLEQGRSWAFAYMRNFFPSRFKNQN